MHFIVGISLKISLNFGSHTYNVMKYNQDITSSCISHTSRISGNYTEIRIRRPLLEVKLQACINHKEELSGELQVEQIHCWVQEGQGQKNGFDSFVRTSSPGIARFGVNGSCVTSLSQMLICLTICLLSVSTRKKFKSLGNQSLLCSKKLLKKLFRCHCCYARQKWLSVS